MEARLLKISQQEHTLVVEAASKFGPVFVNAHDLVFFTWSFISSVTPEAHGFSLFLSQIQKSLVQCLLSAIRDHDVQFHMMLRHALECTSLASYAFFETNLDAYYKTDENDILHPNTKVTEKAYRWLDANYKDHSDKLKNMKDVVNQTFAHASILPGPHNLAFGGTHFEYQYFDFHDLLMSKQRLWWVANVSLGILDLFDKLIKKFPIVTFVDDFPKKIALFSKENTRILIELKSHPRIMRWVDYQS